MKCFISCHPALDAGSSIIKKSVYFFMEMDSGSSPE